VVVDDAALLAAHAMNVDIMSRGHERVVSTTRIQLLHSTSPQRTRVNLFYSFYTICTLSYSKNEQV